MTDNQSVTSMSEVEARAAPGPDAHVPQYRGRDWVGGRLPSRSESWLRPAESLRVSPGHYLDEAALDEVQAYARSKPWVWPSRTVYLLTDVHADADAFVRSLVASGGVERYGPATNDFQLTAQGRVATFVIAGDCFDKGPSNLDLLRSLKRLIDLGADVVLLAGNHDVRALVGMSAIGQRDPRLAHLFVRMGKKTVPLFKELCDHYLRDRDVSVSLAEERQLHERLFPEPRWYRDFPRAVEGLIPPKKIEHELLRIRDKTQDLERNCAKAGLSLAHVAAAVDAFHEQFLRPGGEFSWFFERMQLAYRVGSFLFIHAGLDDELAACFRTDGLDGINAWFRRLLDGRQLFELYHGPVGNAFRTKYRDTDRTLSSAGVRDMHRRGIYAVVHGHRNIVHGQRIVFRSGLLNFECDASIDRNTRVLERLDGEGGAVTIFRADGTILGVSTDFPAIKVFDAARHCGVFTLA